jgi:hypothetical protein
MVLSTGGYQEVGFWTEMSGYFFCLILSSSSTRVLVNGELGESILHNRGLRQGDSLSHALHIRNGRPKFSCGICS